ncbi:MAG: ATPase [Candidatus Levybacteria bacterium CG_4_10_14_0_8_um_filter_35_23]|nr:MAG: ATPase [Candidatus Levybacteria bacterium CG22_combo_CG10-13_8_21_14_all_35_11]PIY94691.1 MAG: ATPase [Candidatus Levybacteria bacterium CG_4_10_14_0_8_um_filter_35_23]PJC54620.1 MAG: ATPase [Candidatus Levybacteria bacterium CG_4_9_14_0_2_um_filter_35_21]
MENSWYSKSISEALKSLHSDRNGLTQEEAKVRIEKYGLNKLPDSKLDSLFLIFFRQFQNPLIYILFAASLIVFLMKDFIDGFIILFVLLFNAIVGTIQEGKAQNTLLALKKFAETNTKVLRDGKELVIPDYEVVPGDVVILQEGDKVPADARIILSNNLTVDEAAMTGESQVVHKFDDILSTVNLPTADQKNMVFKGTNVVVGNGKVLVVATGLETVLGKISKEIAVINTEMPLKANIRYLTRLIIITVSVVCTSIFTLGMFLGHSVKEMFTTVVSLAVSIIPEGLPIVMTLVLATGVWRMSKRNALVKKLQAVEALGQARVIAVDKTGTLTENKIILQKIFVDGKIFTVAGEGYKPEGEIRLNDSKIDPLSHQDLLLCGKIAALGTNNGVLFDEETKTWKDTGDPTESALSVFAQKVGFHKDVLEKESPKLSEIPFDYKNKYHAASHKVDGDIFTTVIGAPEEILRLASNVWHEGKSHPLTAEKKKELEASLVGMYGEGLRVLACALKDKTGEELKPKDIEELTLVGFFGLKDALRPEVHEAVKKAMSAGIKVVMITGDHKITAEAIAREAGIYHDGDTILTGDDIDSLPSEEFVDMLDMVSVFARVTPEHKLKIVQAYRKKGLVVAMTGDGVNDAPSLVAADLGVSMGRIGTEVAREASDIILLDDNFTSIVVAVEEGRSIYKTVKKVILYLFSTSFGEVFTITGALLLGLPLPLLAAQIVWLNFVTDGFLDVSLAMEPKEEGLLKGTFEHPKKYLIDGLGIWRMFLMAITMMIGTLFLFSRYYQADMVKALTVSLTVLAAFQWFNAWNCKHENKSIFQLNPFSNKFLLGSTIIVIFLQLIAIYTPLMQKILHTTSLNMTEWIMIILVASSIVWVEETRKFIYRRTHRNL